MISWLSIKKGCSVWLQGSLLGIGVASPTFPPEDGSMSVANAGASQELNNCAELWELYAGVKFLMGKSLHQGFQIPAWKHVSGGM